MAPKRDYVVHPQYIILTLIILGITALFLGFTASFIYSRVEQGTIPIQLPSLFYYNTILIISSSITLVLAKKAYESDQTARFKQLLWVTLILSIAFLIMQIMAWKELMLQNIQINHSTLASYMYLISGVHFLHLVIGIPFLGHFIYVAYKRMQDPVTVLVYFSDPEKLRSLKLINFYWHYLDGLWIYLVLFFLINYLV